MKNLKMLKDLGYELNILQSIRFNTKIQFDLNGLDKFVNDVMEYNVLHNSSQGLPWAWKYLPIRPS